MFDGFDLRFADLGEARLRFRIGGCGPPVLLLHGHPRTHTTWHKVAPLLAKNYTVVCPDLRGFGESSQPVDTPDHRGSSKRAKAADCVALMQQLGWTRFAIVGHDRGSYVAFRAAMDHPHAISRLVVLDGVPIIEALERCDDRFASAWWHWFFYAQPDKPERAILADPVAWYGADRAAMGEENYADFHRAIHDPRTVHGMLEDYRAGLGIDRLHGEEDRRRDAKLQCPVLCIWSLRDDLEALYGDVLAIWKPWAADLRGDSIDCSHHMAEQAPQALAGRLSRFLRQ